MSGKTILVAEDEKFLRSIIKTKLSGAGFSVIEAKDGEEVLKHIQEGKIDLILLDLMMPNLNGFDVLKKLKADKKMSKIPVIISSNLGQMSDVDKAKKLGAVDYIIKSEVSINEILRKVESYIK